MRPSEELIFTQKFTCIPCGFLCLKLRRDCSLSTLHRAPAPRKGLGIESRPARGGKSPESEPDTIPAGMRGDATGRKA